ncbi:hypothetical protein VTL71DRAFT_11725 [Oculimacula yallundae]|uniref:Amidase domain-containing protein n=1 Tax=Oculimacula yallundae TaxID=86028 RepID=A0ABR4CRJ1_9HELO
MTPTTERSVSNSNLKGWVPVIGDTHGRRPLFDVLTATAHHLQDELIAGRLRSAQIIEEYYRAICAHNGYLNAVYALAPGAMKRAQEMDEKISNGEFLGPLHGIPVLVKDNILTSRNLGMSTTAGSLALDGADSIWNARVIDLEMANRKGVGLHDGWSSIAGQCVSAYVRGGLDPTDGTRGHSSCAGSSAGSAVAVSAGMAPIALGTETNVSLSTPALRAALYSLKPTLGLVSRDGIIPISHRFDTAGPLAKDTRDVADLLSVMVDFRSVPKGGYASAVGDVNSWKDINVGTLDPRTWRYPDSMVKLVIEATVETARTIIHAVIWILTALSQTTKTQEAYDLIKSLADSYHSDVALRSVNDFDIDGENSISEALITDFESDLNRYLGTNQNCRVSTLKELVEWNFAHAEKALPPDLLVKSLAVGDDAQRRSMLLAHMKNVGESLEDTFNKYGIDLIIGPGDCSLRCPLATVPLNCLEYNGRPIGLVVIARPYQESLLLKFMGAFEASFPGRKTPTAFQHAYKI